MSNDPFADEADLDDMSIHPRKRMESSICALLIGVEDTLKSGIAMACRSKKQIENGDKVFVLDLDNANFPLWKDHYDSDENIIVKNPTIFDEVERDGNIYKEIDYERSFARAHTFISNVDVAIKSGEIIVAGFIFDGLDTLLTDAETMMRNFNELDVDDGVNFKFWNRRAKYYNELLKASKALECPKYYITHVKNWKKLSSTKKDGKGQALVDKEWEDGDVEKRTFNKVWQIIDCSKDMGVDGITEYTARIREFKGRPELLGKTFTTMKVDANEGSVKFYGLPVLRDKENVEEVDYSDELFE